MRTFRPAGRRDSEQGWLFALAFLSGLSLTVPAASCQGVQQGNQPPFDISEMRQKYQSSVPGVRQSQQPPVGFPVSVYASNIVSSNFVESPAQRSSAATILTKDDAGTVFRWYQVQLSSGHWNVNEPKVPGGEKQGQMLMLNAKRDATELSIMCLKTEKAPYTVVSITARTAAKAPASR